MMSGVNFQDYSGVSASRLEALEDRLKSDVENELQVFEGRYVELVQHPPY